MAKRKLRVFEAFSGVKMQEMALRNIGINYESIVVSEIDGPAILSAAAIHTNFLEIKDSYEYPMDEEMWSYLESINAPLHHKTFEFIGRKLKNNKLKDMYLANKLLKNKGDISKIDPTELEDFDLFTYSFPCQSISLAGRQEGLEEGTGTKSSLLWECCKIIEEKKPKFLLMENVKNLVGKKFKPEFDKFLSYLEELGYDNHWKILNAKDYGIPQNRERVFCISILGNRNFEFPETVELKTRLKDILEPVVDEKYYINKPFKLVNKKMVKAECFEEKFDQNRRVYGTDGYFQCLGAAERGTNKILVEAMIDDGSTYMETNRILDKRGLCPTLTTMQGGRREPKILTENDYRIRRLTPKECWRLMGISDEDFHKASRINSNSQLYKQAGNGIVVNVLEYIFLSLFKRKNNQLLEVNNGKI